MAFVLIALGVAILMAVGMYFNVRHTLYCMPLCHVIKG